MKTAIIAALISAAATILAAILGMPVVNDWLSSRMRRQSDIPEIMGTKWKADWYFEDGSLYASDTVTLSKWTKNNQFEGFGEVVHQGKEYKYSIAGEVSPNRVVVLTYKAERFPTEANIGVARLELSPSADGLEGIWVGPATTNQVFEPHSGKVSMQKIKELSP